MTMIFPSNVHPPICSALTFVLQISQMPVRKGLEILLPVFSGIDIQETQSESGDRLWTVRDRKKNKQRTFASETDLKIWLDCRAYH